MISEIFKIPKIFRDMLHLRISKVSRVGVSKSQSGETLLARDAILKYWDMKDFHRKDVKRRLFDVIK